MAKERLIAKIVRFAVGGGQSPRTANYGSSVHFKTEDGQDLLWDTMSRKVFDLDEKNPFKISYTVDGESFGTVLISNVRVIQSK